MTRRQRIRTCIFILLATFVISSCYSINPSSKIEQENPDIRGEIKNLILKEGEVTRIYIEGQVEPDTKFGKASVVITKNTKIYIKDSQGYRPGDREDLEIGQTVEALFTGPIENSYPVGANAIKIVVIRFHPPTTERTIGPTQYLLSRTSITATVEPTLTPTIE